MEDWSSIATEVEGALRDVADVSQPDGFPVTLRKAVSGEPAYPGGPPAGDPAYVEFVGFETVREVRDASGTVIDQTIRTITVNATAGAMPSEDDTIALGITAADAGESSAWLEIAAVRPLAPAGVAVMYEIDLVN